MRKLASIQKIVNVQVIPEAHSIDLAQVLGWRCIVDKNKWQSGDFCVFVEIDSDLIAMKDNPAISFLEDTKWRVKSKRFMKQYIAQGLVLPLSVLPEGTVIEEDLDVTELLKIVKYEPKAFREGSPGARGESAGDFPNHLISKTDETRIQSKPSLLKELLDVEVYAALKMDGSSMTVAHLQENIRDSVTNYDGFVVCSRNQMRKPTFRKKTGPETWGEGDDSFWALAKKEGILERLPKGFIVQGEYVGPAVQKNRLNLKEDEFYIFNVWNSIESKFLDYSEFINFCNTYNFKHVPIEGIFKITEQTTVDSLLEMAKGEYPGGHPREGLVIRPIKERYSKRLGGRTSFKAINNDFLIKIGE